MAAPTTPLAMIKRTPPAANKDTNAMARQEVYIKTTSSEDSDIRSCGGKKVFYRDLEQHAKMWSSI